MRKSNKGIIQTAVICISLAVVLMYLYVRIGQIKIIQAEIAKIRAEIKSMSGEKPDLGDTEKMFPEKAGLALLVENLYDAARVSGIKKHEVSSVNLGEAALRRNVKKSSGGGKNGKVLKTYALKISLEGNYRATAEYVRELQNIEQYKRIMELAMKPADKLIKTDITLEIYSEGRPDAAQ